MTDQRHDYLVVDDDSVFAATLARSLKRRGHPARIATTANDALAACEQVPPQRVLLDLKLGESSGLWLIEPLLARAPGCEIVILTGYSNIPTTVEAIKLGASNYLCKPAGVAEILAAFDQRSGNPATGIADQPHSVERLEWEHIQRVLAEHEGNISATARALGMHRRTLQRKLHKRPVKG